MSGGGFLKEVLQGSSHAASTHPSSGSATSHRLSARNSQAVKVILSEAYIRWCSDQETFGLIDTLAREMLAASKVPHPSAPGAGSPTVPGGRPSNGTATAGSVVPQQPQPQESNRHSDPLSTEEQHAIASGVPPEGHRSTSPSPPPSPPMRQRQRKEQDERRTPSPVQHSTRYLGVDELDAHHRLSPGAASPVSPTSMHVASQVPVLKTAAESPHIPVPAHHHPGQSLDTAVFFDSAGRGTSPTEHTQQHKFVSAAGSGGPSFAVQPAKHVPVATVHEVPVFFHKLDPEGCSRDVKIEELDLLAACFSSKQSSLIKASASASRGGRTTGAASVDIDVNKTVRKLQFGKICKEVFGIPIWLKDCLYRRISVANGLTEAQPLNYHFIKKFYDTTFGRLTPNRRLFELLRQNPRATSLTHDDLKLAAKYLVETHPGLEFLKQPEFQDSYCRTVAIRMVYELEQRQQRCIAWPQFDRSDLPDVMRELDETPDINQVLRYFSYEHFYVLYCRFWELDTDRDQLIGFNDLQQYGQGALTPSVLQRVVNGAGRKLTSGVAGKLDFEDFVYFCLSEEDKNHPQAIYYWFKVLDLDADGILSGYELSRFFEDNRARFLDAASDELKFEDMLCQMLDMIGANKIKDHQYGLTLADLKSCEAPANFFNMIFNASKFLNFEHRDPFAEHQQKLLPEKTDWDRFARLEYDRMANEVS